jgi:hypothetical protein
LLEVEDEEDPLRRRLLDDATTSWSWISSATALASRFCTEVRTGAAEHGELGTMALARVSASEQRIGRGGSVGAWLIRFESNYRCVRLSPTCALYPKTGLTKQL